jgi:hypothetical protein
MWPIKATKRLTRSASALLVHERRGLSFEEILSCDFDARPSRMSERQSVPTALQGAYSEAIGRVPRSGMPGWCQRILMNRGKS